MEITDQKDVCGWIGGVSPICINLNKYVKFDWVVTTLSLSIFAKHFSIYKIITRSSITLGNCSRDLLAADGKFSKGYGQWALCHAHHETVKNAHIFQYWNLPYGIGPTGVAFRWNSVQVLLLVSMILRPSVVDFNTYTTLLLYGIPYTFKANKVLLCTVIEEIIHQRYCSMGIYGKWNNSGMVTNKCENYLTICRDCVRNLRNKY